MPDSTEALRQIVDDVLPRLAAIGVVPDAEVIEEVRRHCSTQSRAESAV